MFRSPLIRRVSIYLVLSTTAVTGVNLIGLDQKASTPFYIPLFIGIYIFSRWLDSQLEQRNSLSKAGNTAKNNQSVSNSTGFKT